MAAAGMGDVLTGVIAAHLARGMDPLAAALLGVYLHGRAGDLAASDRRTLGDPRLGGRGPHPGRRPLAREP